MVVGWDSTTQIVWNAASLAFVGVAVVSALRTPKADFAAVGWGKYWLTFWIVVGLSADGWLVLPLPLVWWLYWRPTIRRTVRARAASPAT